MDSTIHAVYHIVQLAFVSYWTVCRRRWTIALTQKYFSYCINGVFKDPSALGRWIIWHHNVPKLYSPVSTYFKQDCACGDMNKSPCSIVLHSEMWGMLWKQNRRSHLKEIFMQKHMLFLQRELQVPWIKNMSNSSKPLWCPCPSKCSYLKEFLIEKCSIFIFYIRQSYWYSKVVWWMCSKDYV